MNITKLSGSIFMVFVLISAPFFAIQTKQDGINRVLAEDFIIKNEINTITNIQIIDNSMWNLTDAEYWDLGSPGTLMSTVNFGALQRTNIIQLPSGTTNVSTNGIWTWMHEVDSDNKIVRQHKTLSGSLENLGGGFIGQFTLQPTTVALAFTHDTRSDSPYTPNNLTFSNLKIEIPGSGIIIPGVTYYDIMENARLANYSDVDAFTNIFYQIPRMANSIANTYNRFIGFTDNLNPFRVRDESTGEFRDQTPSEVMDSWPARIISWFRRFTD